MKVTVELDLNEELLYGALKSAMENYPECSTPSLQCVKWKYEECRYTFQEIGNDGEVEATHVVELNDLIRGFNALLKDRPRCVPLPPVEQTKEAWDDWCCSMDADGVDCLLQFALFGELIYG